MSMTYFNADYGFCNHNRENLSGLSKKQRRTLSCADRTESGCPEETRRQFRLTGVEEDHGLQTHVLLPLKLQLTETGGGCQQHVKDLHDALHTLTLLPAQDQRGGVKIMRQREEE